MKKRIGLFVALCLITSSVAVFGESEPKEPSEIREKHLRIDDSIIIRENINAQMFGCNAEYSSGWGGGATVRSRGGGFLLNEDGSPNQKTVEETRGYAFCHARLGGGNNNEMRWKEDLGPLHLRSMGTVPRYTGFARLISGQKLRNLVKRDYNIVDYIRCYQALGGEEVTFTVTLNVIADTLENQIDLVEFLSSDGTVNYNGGENWGKIRREVYGIEKVNMFAYELGNEANLNKTDFVEYLDMVKKVIPAIRMVDPDTPIAVHQKASDNSPVGAEWQRQLFKECGDMFDYIVMHKYFNPATVNAVAESGARNLISDIEKYGDPERHKILFTEYNTNFKAQKSGDGGGIRNTSIYAAVGVADYFNRILHYPQIIEADFHCLQSGGGGESFRVNGSSPDGGPWWALYVDTDNVVKGTAPFDIIRIFWQNSTDAKVIKSELDGFTLGKGADDSALCAINDDGEILVFLANKALDTKLALTLDLPGEYYIKQEITMVGKNGQYSTNFKDRKEVDIVEKLYKDKVPFSKYEMEALSFAMLRLAPISQ